MRRPVKRAGSNNFYYRTAIPQAVRAAMQRKGVRPPAEKWKSLGIPDLQEAKRRLALLQGEQQREWDRLLGVSEVNDSRIGSSTLTVIARRIRIKMQKIAEGKLAKQLEDGDDFDHVLSDWKKGSRSANCWDRNALICEPKCMTMQPIGFRMNMGWR